MKFTDINIQFIKWYHKLFLWIIPKTIVIDCNKTYKHTMVFKRLFGKTFILSNKYQSLPDIPSKQWRINKMTLNWDNNKWTK